MKIYWMRTKLMKMKMNSICSALFWLVNLMLFLIRNLLIHLSLLELLALVVIRPIQVCQLGKMIKMVYPPYN